MVHPESVTRQASFQILLCKMILAEIAAAPAHLQLAQPKATPEVTHKCS
jgi:hypothetical protein